MKNAIIFFVCTFFFLKAIANDTIFIRAHKISEAINIDYLNENEILVRTANRLYSFDGERFKKLNIPVDKKYSWTHQFPQSNALTFTHSNYMPAEKILEEYQIENFIPGPFSPVITRAFSRNRMYILYNGNLIEYQINNHYNLFLKGKSTRHIYPADSFLIISTYNGIYFSSDYETLKCNLIEGVYYSNGELNKIFDRLLLCSDNLYEILNDSSMTMIKSTLNTPKYRSLIERNDHVIGLFNTSLEILNKDLHSDKTLLKDIELSDAALINDDLLASSVGGKVWMFNDKYNLVRSHQLNPVNDIYIHEDTIYICTNSGIEILDQNLSHIYSINHPDVLQSFKREGILIFAANNGLYSLINGQIIPLIENVEFNRKALTFIEPNIFAGSVNGLYVLNWDFLTDVMLSNIGNIHVNSTSIDSVISYLLIFALFVSIVIFFVIFKKNKDRPKIDFSLKVLETTIINNPTILSVPHLAESVGMSTVHLNRKLKEFNITPGELMRSAKMKLAQKLYNDGVSIDKISARIGYSSRYVKRHISNPVEIK